MVGRVKRRVVNDVSTCLQLAIYPNIILEVICTRVGEVTIKQGQQFLCIKIKIIYTRVSYIKQSYNLSTRLSEVVLYTFGTPIRVTVKPVTWSHLLFYYVFLARTLHRTFQSLVKFTLRRLQLYVCTLCCNSDYKEQPFGVFFLL